MQIVALPPELRVIEDLDDHIQIAGTPARVALLTLAAQPDAHPVARARRDLHIELALPRLDAESVTCFGSGRIQEHLIPKYNSPFAIETAHIKMKGADLVAEVMRSLFNTARQYRESFDVYGSKMSFEWPLIEHQPPVVHIGETPHLVNVLDFAHLLPEPLQRFTTKGVYGKDVQHLSFIQGAGHGGSHPHMTNEFVTSIVENREPFPNARQSANWTAVGILAHESAMKGGVTIKLPSFTLSS